MNHPGGSCTVGLVHQSIGLPFYFTSSHCTKKWGELDNDANYVFTNASFSGTELNDYPHFNCSVFARCLYADAAPVGISYFPTTLTIAGTMDQPGSITIDPANPLWYIVEEEQSFVAVGDSLYKIGYKTGFTGGRVERTCYDYIAKFEPVISSPAYRWLLCQAQASYHSAGGDSGGPVFVIVDKAASTVEIVGLHDGRHQRVGQPYFYLNATYSPMRQIRAQYNFDPIWY